MKSTFLFSVFPFFLLLLIGCKDQIPSQEDPSSVVLPDSNISYSRDVERLFSSRCLSCHSGSNGPNLIPPSYNSLMSYQPQLIVSGKSQTSLLVQLLEGTLPPPMPPGSQKLTQNQINGIKRWIDEGALNN